MGSKGRTKEQLLNELTEARHRISELEVVQTKLKQVEEGLQTGQNYPQNLVDNALNMIISVDQNHRIVEFNPAAQKVFGYSREEVVGKHVGILYANPEEGSEANRLTRKRGWFTGEVLNKRKDGNIFTSFLAASKLQSAVGKFLGVMGVLQDITEHKQLEQQLQEMASRDYLTGLWNHREFQTRLETELARAQRSNSPLSLLFLDIDNFKMTNSKFGHQRGDKVLKIVGEFLERTVRVSDIPARYGGDEFTVIMPDTNSKQACTLARRILREFSDLHHHEAKLKDLTPQLGLSIGIANCSVEALEAQDLVRKANQAMFYAKSLGGNRLQAWDEVIESFETDPKKLRDILRQANLDVAVGMAAAIDARDVYTMGHSQRVSELAVKLASELGMGESDIERVRVAALLHDVGKIGVPDSVLKKPRRLTKEESAIMQGHVEMGIKILSGLGFMEDKLDLVRDHHENWDGSGYPRGISGKQIALGARIIRVADTFDAMTSERRYRKRLDNEEALKEMEKLAGKCFDPVIMSMLGKAVRLSGSMPTFYYLPATQEMSL